MNNNEPLTVVVKRLLPTPALFKLSTCGSAISWRHRNLLRSRNGKGVVRVQSDFQRAIAYFPGTCDIGAFGAYDRKQFTFMSKNINNCEGN